MCAREVTWQLIETRPDAIYVVPSRSEMTGMATSVFFNPFIPGFTMTSSPTYQTTAVGYAMRALRVSLPFRRNLASGIVTDVTEKSAGLAFVPITMRLLPPVFRIVTVVGLLVLRTG